MGCPTAAAATVSAAVVRPWKAAQPCSESTARRGGAVSTVRPIARRYADDSSRECYIELGRDRRPHPSASSTISITFLHDKNQHQNLHVFLPRAARTQCSHQRLEAPPCPPVRPRQCGLGQLRVPFCSASGTSTLTADPHSLLASSPGGGPLAALQRRQQSGCH